jgi:hypothetical protein
LRLQYPEHAEALEERFLQQSGFRLALSRFHDLYEVFEPRICSLSSTCSPVLEPPNCERSPGCAVRACWFPKRWSFTRASAAAPCS